ncbi:hypothetical protein F5878DRAFT_606999 [Lentinula raphanica]|uniref:Uncharacterized protein n=1 Tax=Lentinula raphanica TaxID=153919 RepID=A0AA38PGV8_9AGAR|nr:hypothetical protein F5880DRAFT_1592314 [Lentinula raphanica]KAJ3842673.1 hypothetical protein F5878DRAFT_606999 [Lentinula raphanica]
MELPQTTESHTSNSLDSSHAITHFTSQLTALIDQERIQVAESYQRKLAEVESQHTAALDEATFFRAQNEKMTLSYRELQHQLDIAKRELADRGDTSLSRQTRCAAGLLVSYFRKQAAKFRAMHNDSTTRLVQALSEQQAMQIELKLSRARTNALEQELQQLETSRAAERNERESLESSNAALKKSLVEVKATELSAKTYAYYFREQSTALQQELVKVKADREAEQQRLLNEAVQLRQDLERAKNVALRHETRANDTTKRLEILSQLLGLHKREPSSTFNGVQHQVETGHPTVAQVQDQSLSLSAQHSTVTETVLPEARTSPVDAQTHANEQIEDLRRQLSSVQENRDDLEKRISSLADALHHHELAIHDPEFNILKPSPRLVSIWEAIYHLLPVSEQQNFEFSVCFPELLTKDTTAVTSAIYALVDRLRSCLDAACGRLRQTLAERDLRIRSLQDQLAGQTVEPSLIVVSPISPSMSLSDDSSTAQVEAERPSESQTPIPDSELTVVKPEQDLAPSLLLTPSTNIPSPLKDTHDIESFITSTIVPVHHSQIEVSPDTRRMSIAGLPSPRITPSKPLVDSEASKFSVVNEKPSLSKRKREPSARTDTKRVIPPSSASSSNITIDSTRPRAKRSRAGMGDSSQSVPQKRRRKIDTDKEEIFASTPCLIESTTSRTRPRIVRQLAYVEIVVPRRTKQHFPRRTLTETTNHGPSPPTDQSSPTAHSDNLQETEVESSEPDPHLSRTRKASACPEPSPTDESITTVDSDIVEVAISDSTPISVS